MDRDTQWLREARLRLLGSNEWQGARILLTDTVQKHLANNESTLFTEINDSQKQSVFTNALQALEQSPLYQQLSGLVTSVLDQSLQENAREDGRPDAVGRSTLMLDASASGAASLLERWPELKQCFRLCLNKPLPPDLRSVYWRSSFFSEERADRFVFDVRHRPTETVSVRGADIAQLCLSVAKAESLMSSNTWSMEVDKLASAMLAILMYRDAVVFSDRQVQESDHAYRLAPMLFVFFGEKANNFLISHSTTVDEVRSLPEALAERANAPLTVPEAQQLSAVVSCYLSFLEQGPLCSEPLTSPGAKEAANAVAKGVEELLQKHKDSLLVHLRNVLTKHESIAQNVPSYKYLRNLLHPTLRCLFADMLPLEVVCFIWEQCWLGRGVPNYHFLAVTIASWLSLLDKPLCRAVDRIGLERALRDESLLLTVDDFCAKIEETCLPDLRSALACASQTQGAYPSLAAGHSQPPPWVLWSQERRTLKKAADSKEERARRLQRLELLRREVAEEKRLAEEAKKRQEQEMKRRLAEVEEKLEKEQSRRHVQLSELEQLREENRCLEERLAAAASAALSPIRQPPNSSAAQPKPAVDVNSKSTAPSAALRGASPRRMSRSTDLPQSFSVSHQRSQLTSFIGSDFARLDALRSVTPESQGGNFSMGSSMGSGNELAAPTRGDLSQEQTDDLIQQLVVRTVNAVDILLHGPSGDRGPRHQRDAQLQQAYNADNRRLERQLFGSTLEPYEWQQLSRSEYIDRQKRITEAVLRHRQEEMRQRQHKWKVTAAAAVRRK